MKSCSETPTNIVIESSKRARSSKYNELGASFFELAFVMPFLLLVFVALVELGNFLSVSIELANTAYSSVLVGAKTSETYALAAIQERRNLLKNAMTEKSRLNYITEDSLVYDYNAKTVSLKLSSEVNPIIGSSFLVANLLGASVTAPLLDSTQSTGIVNAVPTNDESNCPSNYDCRGVCGGGFEIGALGACLDTGGGDIDVPPGVPAPTGVIIADCNSETLVDNSGFQAGSGDDGREMQRDYARVGDSDNGDRPSTAAVAAEQSGSNICYYQGGKAKSNFQ